MSWAHTVGKAYVLCQWLIPLSNALSLSSSLFIFCFGWITSVLVGFISPTRILAGNAEFLVLTHLSFHLCSQPLSHHWLNVFVCHEEGKDEHRQVFWLQKAKNLGGGLRGKKQLCTKISNVRNQPVPLVINRWIPTHFRKRNDFWFPGRNQDEIWWERESN